MGLKGGFGYNIDHERNNPDEIETRDQINLLF